MQAHKCKVDGIDIPLGASRRISPCTSCTCTRENVSLTPNNQLCLNLIAQAECQSLRVNNCRQLIAEVGVEAVRRDNICKTQCSFALTSPLPVANLVQTAEGTLTAPLPPKRGGRDHPSHLPRPPSASRPLPQPPPPPPRVPLRPGFSGPGAPFFTTGPSGPGSRPPPQGAPPPGPQPHRQPRPLFTFPSIRLPNLSDLFGL